MGHNHWTYIALVTMVTVPETILKTVTHVSKLTTGTDNYWRGWNWLSYILALIILCVIIWGYKEKIKIFFVNKRMKLELRRGEKINSINRVVFDALYSSNSAKIAEIFRYTYGTVAEWNPINYRENVLVYDVHEQIRSILKSLESCIINIDPDRLNDRNVTVGLVYCYPCGDHSESKLPLDKIKKYEKEKNPNLDWKLITSGDTSGNHKSVLDYLSQPNSFYVLVDSCGTVFKNDKFSEIKEYQERLLPPEVSEGSPRTCYIKDVKDWEHSKNGKCKGSVIGTVINIRNDNPEEVFVKAILTITTYGESFFVKDGQWKDGKTIIDIDKDGMSEEDYCDVILNSVIASFSKLIETELAQMYIRHSIKKGKMCPKSGRISKGKNDGEDIENADKQENMTPTCGILNKMEENCGICNSCECQVKKRKLLDKDK